MAEAEDWIAAMNISPLKPVSWDEGRTAWIPVSGWRRL